MSNLIPVVLSAIVVGAVALSRRLVPKPPDPVVRGNGNGFTRNGDGPVITQPPPVTVPPVTVPPVTTPPVTGPQATQIVALNDEVYVPAITMPAGSFRVPAGMRGSAAIILRVDALTPTAVVGTPVAYAVGAERTAYGGAPLPAATVSRAVITHVVRGGQVVATNPPGSIGDEAFVPALFLQGRGGYNIPVGTRNTAVVIFAVEGATDTHIAGRSIGYAIGQARTPAPPFNRVLQIPRTEVTFYVRGGQVIAQNDAAIAAWQARVAASEPPPPVQLPSPEALAAFLAARVAQSPAVQWQLWNRYVDALRREGRPLPGDTQNYCVSTGGVGCPMYANPNAAPGAQAPFSVPWGDPVRVLYADEGEWFYGAHASGYTGWLSRAPFAGTPPAGGGRPGGETVPRFPTPEQQRAEDQRLEDERRRQQPPPPLADRCSTPGGCTIIPFTMIQRYAITQFSDSYIREQARRGIPQGGQVDVLDRIPVHISRVPHRIGNNPVTRFEPDPNGVPYYHVRFCFPVQRPNGTFTECAEGWVAGYELAPP